MLLMSDPDSLDLHSPTQDSAPQTVPLAKRALSTSLARATTTPSDNSWSATNDAS
jgi:hypothetical protein